MSLLELMTQQTAGGSDPAVAIHRRTAGLKPEPLGEPRRDDSTADNEAPVVTALYVASNLDTWETKESNLSSRDVSIDAVCYRQLDPEYYAWLRYKMALAKKALESGRLDPVAFDELRTRFNRFHLWALERIGEQDLLAPVRTLDPKAYSPPTSKPALKSRVVCPAQDRPVPPFAPDLLPEDGVRFFTETITPSAVAKVNGIRDRAMALGWNESRLYQNRGRFRFPCGGDYGLVCFIGEAQRIGELTGQYIEIVGPSPREYRWRFYNPDVAQPWMGTVVGEKCLSARVVRE
ncbi:MAG: hypothetical protein HY648_11040 [Acidobacteria bacterium]|nr:hypothetical protein [Acidobacteriota bacterium]